jgi:hypothetical protein
MTNMLVCDIHEPIAELEERIDDGDPFDNPKANQNRRTEYLKAPAHKASTRRRTTLYVDTRSRSFMDSLQATRPNASGFQLRLRDKTQSAKKRQTRQVPVGFVGFSSLAPCPFRAKARKSPLHV